MTTTQRALMSTLCLILSACTHEAVEDDDDGDGQDEERVGEAADAFTGSAGLSVTAYGGLWYDRIQVSPGTGSFLTAAYGNFGFSAETYPEIHLNTWVADWFVVSADNGNNQDPSTHITGGEAWAIYPTVSSDKRSCTHSGPGIQPVALPNPGGSYHCFLTGMRNTTGSSWNTSDDEAYIAYPSGQPTLYCRNDSEATAQCVTVSGYLGAVSAFSPSSTSTDLGPVDSSLGKVCGLTAIRGFFRIDSTGSGVWAHTVGSNWYFDTSPYKGGSVSCVY